MTTADLPQDAIAIIGMSGRFPGAPDVQAFWDQLRAERSSIRPATASEQANIGGSIDGAPFGVAMLDGADCFDNEFFGMSDQESVMTDPQHRLFLECVWQAIESAGYDPTADNGTVALYAGSCFPTYLTRVLANRPDLVAEFGDLATVLANDADALTALVAFKLNLQGPCLSVRSYSSSSLVAVHLACQSLLSREADLAVAGAAAVKFPQATAYAGTSSPTGRCRPLDERADGSVVGNAVAAVVLKRAEDAVRDGDHVHALILGTAVNTDGSRRAGLYAPGPHGKAAVVAEALGVAGVAPDDIDFVETNAIGTRLGDQIEVAALAKVLRSRERTVGPCLLGAVSANVGHLDAVAGVAGMIKTALMLEHREVIGQPEPIVPLAAARQAPGVVEVCAKSGPWHSTRPIRAGVSSFGIAGVNAHAVLQEPPRREIDDKGADHGAPVPIMLSARTPRALIRSRARLADWLGRHQDARLADIAHTLDFGRADLPYRWATVAGGIAELRSRLIDDSTATPADGPAPVVRSSGEPTDGAQVGGPSPGRRIPLPTYPFEPTRQWPE